MKFSLYLDSDSLPISHRKIILKRAIKLNLDTVFVADRELKDVLDAIKEHTIMLREPYLSTLEYQERRKIKSSIKMVVVSSASDSADDYIVDNISLPAICITHDIPLAHRLVSKGVLVLDDRGDIFTKENINERLSIRDSMQTFREMGIVQCKQKAFTSKIIENFSNAFDKVLTSYLTK